jgi:bifunctional non-homologous end joining protein LigD
MPVTFSVFDLLALDGRRMTRAPYEERRACLDELGLLGPTWCTLPSWRDVDVRALLVACADNDVEGVVAKRLDGRYECGRRSASWVKVKTREWRAAHASRRHEQHAPV